MPQLIQNEAPKIAATFERITRKLAPTRKSDKEQRMAQSLIRMRRHNIPLCWKMGGGGAPSAAFPDPDLRPRGH
jgi:hypothetical protein